MGQLIVRNLDDIIVLALKRRAAKHGRSAEAEHREILRQALVEDNERLGFKEFLLSMPRVGEDSDFDLPRGPVRDVE